jgi:CubicO group peptidase (beta-lactamase class C family)
MIRAIGFWLATGLLLAAGATHAADAVPAATKKLNAYFDALQAQGTVNGSIAISERGVMRYQRSLGFATIEKGIPQPADSGTRYRIGSVTKLFTAVLTMQLAESASITLDNKLAEFYPDLPNAIKITYRNLLQQRSGLANYSDARDFTTWRNAARTHAEMLDLITAGGARFAPGERVEYNDTNYLLLGYVLEKVYERSYDEIVRRQITSKLGLVRTYFVGTGSSSTLESIPYQATADGWQAEIATDPAIDGGSGGMVSNATDLVTFMDAVFTAKIVTPYTLESMRDQGGGSGIGLWPRTIAGNGALGERGTVGAFNACVYHFPDRKISIAWTGNASRLPMDEIVEEALRLIFEKGRKPPKVAPPNIKPGE